VAALLVLALGVGGALLATRGSEDAAPKVRASHEVATRAPTPAFDATKPVVDQQPPASATQEPQKPLRSFDPKKPAIETKPELTAVTIMVKPARATVRVDGVLVSGRPILLKKSVGTRLVVVASLAGYDRRAQTISVPNRARYAVQFTLHRTRVHAHTKPKPPSTPKPKPKPIDFDPTKPEIE